MWFRRDLRLEDNPALCLAAASGSVLPVFIFDDHLWNRSGDNRRVFLKRSLQALSESVGGALVQRSGEPADVLLNLCVESGATNVYASEDFGPYGRQRDEHVSKTLAAAGRSLTLCDSPYAVPPGSVFTGGGTPYKVFTPFFRAWKGHGWSEPMPAPEPKWYRELRSGPTPTEPSSSVDFPDAGEQPAWIVAEEFLASRVESYQTNRDLPAVAGTSRLSPYLKWGVIHPRQLLAKLGHSPGEETFRSELCWREFYAEVLFQRPDSARESYVSKMSGMVVDSGPDADRRFEAWATGQTGYPIVDAGMRELLATGWMHNRVRMIVASFLVKDLHLDWRRGARLFMTHLIDGDLASNNHGWQWVAGTGTDASPYFRVFNPTTQSKKFDPQGEYLRKWLPEIAHLPNKSIHEPWTEKTGAPAGYPGPLVDHAVERKASLDRYEQLKRTWV